MGKAAWSVLDRIRFGKEIILMPYYAFRFILPRRYIVTRFLEVVYADE